MLLWWKKKQTSPGKAGLEDEVRGKIVLFCVIWRVSNGKVLLTVPRISGETCVEFKVVCVFSAEMPVNQWLTGSSTKET